MRYIKILLGALLLINVSCKKGNKDLSNDILFAEKQIENCLRVCDDVNQIPRSIGKDGKVSKVWKYDWTSGFFAGSLWYMYKLTGEDKWKNEATRWTEALDTIQYWSGNHDVGFMIGCSYGNGIRFAGKNEYKKVMVNTAESLSKRFNPVIGCIKSWEWSESHDKKRKWEYPVIVDNMMNLELMFEASIISGNDKYKNIALTHAKNTMLNQFREDYSSYHVVNYDKKSGKATDAGTHQGYSDNSSWARGQAWGLYGFVMCYRYSKDKTHLDFAKNIADYIIHNENIPEDKIPYWDYHVNKPGYNESFGFNKDEFDEIKRDASAAAITASALLELSKYLDNSGYYKYAEQILNSLSDKYKADSKRNKYFILDHCVGHYPGHSEIDVPLNYADYYYLEALYRYFNRK